MKILSYNEYNLASSLSNNDTDPSIIKSKNHFTYLKGYLGETGLSAKTIVKEETYISKDYLHDYASYYAFCYENYSKYCKRIHFFDIEFTQEEFENIILQKDVPKDFWDHYLGFIVVKPIPVTVIGYTVLKTYKAEHGEFNTRNFWGTRPYKIHLFGNEVQVTSLAFQEQDSVLAACATTAIWSMLNKASIDFHTILKSPSEITKDADTISPDGSRLFPNKGLNLLQICQAIFNSGLVSEIKQPDFPVCNDSGVELFHAVSHQYLKKIISAYSAIGIPIILIIRVPDGRQHGYHAITVSGYKQKGPTEITLQNDISWLSDNIEKFYAHDDQWGPFTRIDFMEDDDRGPGIETPWTTFHSDRAPTYVTNVVVSLYPKIRINYEDIEVIVLGLDRILSLFFDKRLKSDLVWEIKIDYSESFKTNIKSSALAPQDKLIITTEPLPKYLWIASCYTAEHKIFEFTFDATGVSSGMIGKHVICYLKDTKEVLKEFLEKNADLFIEKRIFRHRSSERYYRHLIEKLS